MFETIVDDLRVILRLAAGRTAQPSAVVIDGQTVQSTPESGENAGCDGAKKRRGRKLHFGGRHTQRNVGVALICWRCMSSIREWLQRTRTNANRFRIQLQQRPGGERSDRGLRHDHAAVQDDDART